MLKIFLAHFVLSVVSGLLLLAPPERLQRLNNPNRPGPLREPHSFIVTEIYASTWLYNVLVANLLPRKSKVRSRVSKSSGACPGKWGGRQWR